ncbi:hypothetical protein JW962_00405 [Candidatus Dojkabacteria bacterium]|nr:hypothetical protein [Candidatus Dojkabacteria bacterium]
MNILEHKFKSKTIGLSMIGFSVIVIIIATVFGIFWGLFGLGSGIDVVSLIPLILLVLLLVLLGGIGVYVGIRYFKKKGFKQNETLGSLMIFGSLIYFLYKLVTVILSNLTGNEGGWLQPVFALILVFWVVPLGYAIRNGTK